MKKNLIVAIAIILIATHVIPPYNISFANEEENNCELMNFTVQTIKEDDDKLEGKASANQKFEIEFIRQDVIEEITSDNNGKLEYKFEDDYLKENDKIIITNEYHKIETIVVSDIEDSKEIKSELYIECVLGKEDAKSEAVDEVTEESTESEVVDKVTEESTESEVVDKVTEESTESEVVDKVTEEIPASEELDEVTEAESISKEDKNFDIDSSVLKEPASKKTDNSNEKNNKTQEENVRDDLLTPRVFLESKLNYKSKNTSADLYNISKSIKEVRNNNFKSALEDRNVEYIKLTENIKTDGTIDVKSESGIKIIDGQGKYSINLGKGQFYLNNGILELFWGREVRKFVLKNIPDIVTENTSNNNGLIRKESRISEIHFENVNFNRDNINNAGMIGSSWESDIYFHGSNTVNSRTGNYVMAFSKVIVSENSSLTINNSNGNTVFNYDNGTIFKEKPESYGITVDTNGTLDVNSNSLVVDSNLSGGRKLNYRFGIGTEVGLTGQSSSILNSESESDMFVVNPKKIKLENSSGNRLFNSDEKVRFFITESTLKGWSADNAFEEPSNISNHINDGRFTFDGNSITNKTGLQQNFSELFKADSRKIVFEKNINPIEAPVVEDIYQGDEIINGHTVPNATINLYYADGGKIATVTSDDKGDFDIIIDKPLKLDQELIFRANISHVQSPEVRKIVLGTKLKVPEFIKFQETEISTSEKEIYREKDKLSISIFDNRPNVDWKLTVQALPLSYQDNTINNSVFYVKNNEWKSIEEEAVTVANESDFDSDSKKKEISWCANEGILLKLNPIQAKADTEYSTTIEWTLTDGP